MAQFMALFKSNYFVNSPEFSSHIKDGYNIILIFYCRSMSFFMGGNVRAAVADGRGDVVPIFLHEIPLLFYKKILIPDICLIHVSVEIDLYAISTY